MKSYQYADKRITNLLGSIAIIIACSISARSLIWYIFNFTDTLQGGDSAYYIAAAKNLISQGYYGEGTFPDKFRPPLYSIWLVIASLEDKEAYTVYVTQSVLHTLCVLVFYLSLRHIDLTQKYNPILLASLLIAASPFHAIYNGRILSENLATALILLSIIPLVRDSRSLINLTISAVLLGLLTLTREIYLLMPLMVAGYLILRRVPSTHIATFLLAFTLVLSPWVLRNTQIKSSASNDHAAAFWLTLWIGTWERDPHWTKTKKELPKEAYATLRADTSKEELDTAFKNSDQAFFKAQVLDYVKRNPGHVVASALVRHRYLWLGTRSELFTIRAETRSPTWYAVKSTLYAYNFTLLSLAIVAILLSWNNIINLTPLMIPIFYTSIIYFFFHNTESRYSQPSLPVIELLAACTLINAWRKHRFKG